MPIFFLGVWEFAKRLPWQVWAVAAIFAVLAATGGYIHYTSYRAGSAAATKEISDANRASEKRAANSASAVDRCYDAGGTWDRAHGLCDRSR